MKVLLHPAYFPNIATVVTMEKHQIVWETQDNYQKQTYRNRCHICTDQGKHLLTIPIKHVGGSSGRQKYKDVKIDNSYRWQQQHWRTLETAYRTSAFFEFYEDELEPLFAKRYEFLMDFNLESIEFISEALGIMPSKEKTNSYQSGFNQGIDGRFLVNAKKELAFKNTPYFQVFEHRNGFTPNTCSLDLLFNEGTNALSYLKNQNLPFLNA
ncbi:WbqC family protein [Croceitalea rosinachiae]|uniref:WbqC family protein n=1 Tax=Croceitalea rosinachiae TaxID=3075596 RepID=A0ABU3AD12_9FLAO|nr:WbqC family protein [Croceitalea sp. F388]MDT0607003.1 WbqC family protein [Croceitalea sp. F388]